MMKTPLGEDVVGDDPTIKELERLATEKTGFESAFFVLSGTMVMPWRSECGHLLLMNSKLPN